MKITIKYICDFCPFLCKTKEEMEEHQKKHK